MKSIILISCFLPIVIIYIIMKVEVWLSDTSVETIYVKDTSKRPQGPYLADAYADVDKEKEESWNLSDN